MKLALVFPRVNCTSSDPPLGIASLAGYLAKECPEVDLRIFDSSFDADYSRITGGIRDFAPDIAGIFIDTVMYMSAVHLIGVFRDLGIPTIIAGGPHTAVLPQSIEKLVDALFIGEAERPLAFYLKNFETEDRYSTPSAWIARNGSMVRNESPCYLLPEELPTPLRTQLAMQRYTRSFYYLDSISTGIRGTTLIASRGCPYRCAYCQPSLEKMFGKGIRYRPVLSVIEEMERLIKDYRLEGFFFHDDTFFARSGWIDEFIDEIQRSKLRIVWGCNSRVDTLNRETIRRARETGLRVVHLGIESVVDRIVNGIYRKGMPVAEVNEWINWLDSERIKVLGFFMIGGPSETEAEIQKTVRFARNSKLSEGTFSITTPIPGTALYDIVKNNPEYILSGDFRDYNYYSRRAFAGNTIPLKKLHRIQLSALIGFYLTGNRLRYLVRHLFSLQGCRKLWEKMQRYI